MKSIPEYKNALYKSIYGDIPVFDCHTHIMNDTSGIDKLAQLKDLFGFNGINVLSISGIGDLTQNLKCLLFKAVYPQNVYAFGGLVHTQAGFGTYFDQVRRLISMGFDGMKMIEGKPEIRKRLGKQLDHKDFDKYYEFLEAKEIPVLFHVADPETFWDIKEIPRWALDNGWFYGNGGYNSKEELHSEVEGILRKFPKLHAIFAHFYFLSADLNRAANFLDEFENVSLDLTPGTEMYVNFSKNPDKTREFFIKYQNRIMFGTDTCDPKSCEELINMIKTVNLSRMFLETDREYQVWDLKFKGISLDRQVLEKIYNKNILRYVGNTPKRIKIDAVCDECREIINFVSKNSNSPEIIDELQNILNRFGELL